jgi:hypothetical protein
LKGFEFVEEYVGIAEFDGIFNQIAATPAEIDGALGAAAERRNELIAMTVQDGRELGRREAASRHCGSANEDISGEWKKERELKGKIVFTHENQNEVNYMYRLIEARVRFRADSSDQNSTLGRENGKLIAD